MSILVTGGAGYIGSVVLELLLEADRNLVVLDNLSRGNLDAVPPGVPMYVGDVADEPLVLRIIREHRVTSCIHFAALAYVGESVADPELYFQNNVAQGVRLLASLRSGGVKRFVFSSSCATYGEPLRLPMDEDHPQQPTNPYGLSKLFLEKILQSYSTAYDFRFVALRYFNAAGATEEHGELHEPETHLIPNVLRAADGEIPYVDVFGQHYPTPDGTAIRDYIHIADLASAHILALDYLRDGGPSEYLNIGTGRGHSVMDVIETAARVTGRDVPYRIQPARTGDPAQLVAGAEKARRILSWKARSSYLEDIIASVWQWRQRSRRRIAVAVAKSVDVGY
jgi:UDP-glucose-4-epimerase GalE